MATETKYFEAHSSDIAGNLLSGKSEFVKRTTFDDRLLPDGRKWFELRYVSDGIRPCAPIVLLREVPASDLGLPACPECGRRHCESNGEPRSSGQLVWLCLECSHQWEPNQSA